MSTESITAGIGEIRIGKSPKVLQAIALGSCVGIALYDPQPKLGGLSHAMLPLEKETRKHSYSPGKFVDSAILLMIHKLVKKGAKPNRFVSKLVGGARMFEIKNLDIGTRNVQSARAALKNAAIPIVAEDVGKDFGRTVHFYLSTGKLLIRKAGGSRRHWREL